MGWNTGALPRVGAAPAFAAAPCFVLCWALGLLLVILLAGRAARKADPARRALGGGVRGALGYAFLRDRDALPRAAGLDLSLQIAAQDCGDRLEVLSFVGGRELVGDGPGLG